MSGWRHRLIEIAGPFRRSLSGVLLFAFAGLGLEILKPWPVKLAVDSVLARQPLPEGAAWLERLPGSASSSALLGWLAVGTLLILIAAWFAKLAQRHLQTGLGGRLTFTLGGQLFEHLQRLSLSYHTRASSGDLVKRVTSDARCARDLWVGTLVPGLTSLATLVAMFAVMWWLDPLLSLLALLVAPLHLIAMRNFNSSIADRSYQEMTAQGVMMSSAGQALSALPVVQAYGQEEREERKFSEVSRQSGLAYLKSMVAQLQFSLTVGTISAVGRAAMLGLSGGFVLAGRISVGDMIVFMSYLVALYAPMESLAQLTTSYSTAAAGARRVFEVMDTAPQIRDAFGARDLSLPAGARAASVEFENIEFRYDPARPVLENVSFVASAGETIAIVGESGAGKSTLANLLLRFEEPQDGRILINGEDIRRLTLSSLRDHIAVVFQSPMLLPVSVAENIAYGRPEATLEEIRAAAEAAQAHEFISNLPSGYATVLSEKGATLSGGEQQRLAIARAILKNAPIVILDEPTSSLDADTEEALMTAIGHLTKGRTVFLIAHRRTTLRRADRIVEIGRDRRRDEVFA